MTENGGVSSVVNVAALPYLAHLISRVAQSPLAVTVAKVPLQTDFFFLLFLVCREIGSRWMLTLRNHRCGNISFQYRQLKLNWVHGGMWKRRKSGQKNPFSPTAS